MRGCQAPRTKSVQSTPVSNTTPNPSGVPLAERNTFLAKENRLLSLLFTAAVEAAHLPPQRHGQVNPSPPPLCQRDLNPQPTFLPLCPPASPRSLLLDAPLLSGSESVDLGLPGCVKDHPSGSQPWTPPNSSAHGLVPGSQRTRGSYKEVTIQTQQSHMSRDSLYRQ